MAEQLRGAGAPELNDTLDVGNDDGVIVHGNSVARHRRMQADCEPQSRGAFASRQLDW
jgi:hypothetical protein